MGKSLKDILNGKKSSKVEKLKLGDDPGVDYAPKPEAEKNWVDNHTVEKHADRVGNEDDVYKATNVKRAELGRHGHVPTPKDLKVYKLANEEIQLDEVSGHLLARYIEKKLPKAEAKVERVMRKNPKVDPEKVAVKDYKNIHLAASKAYGHDPDNPESPKVKVPATWIKESENKKTEAYMAREQLLKIKADKEKAKLEKLSEAALADANLPAADTAYHHAWDHVDNHNVKNKKDFNNAVTSISSKLVKSHKLSQSSARVHAANALKLHVALKESAEPEVLEEANLNDYHNTIEDHGFELADKHVSKNTATHLYKKPGKLLSHEHLILKKATDGKVSWTHSGKTVRETIGSEHADLNNHLGAK